MRRVDVVQRGGEADLKQQLLPPVPDSTVDEHRLLLRVDLLKVVQYVRYHQVIVPLFSVHALEGYRSHWLLPLRIADLIEFSNLALNAIELTLKRSSLSIRAYSHLKLVLETQIDVI